MSYLTSILSSLGTDAPKAPAISAGPAPPPAAKRKAEDDLTNRPAKRPTTPANGQNGDLKRPITPSSSTNGIASRPRPIAQPAKDRFQVSAPPNAQPTVKKETIVSKPAAVSSPAQPQVTKNGARPATVPIKSAAPAPVKAPPKKGSYAEILARAKAAQQAKTPVGLITHKQGEKVDRKKELKSGAKDKNGKPLDKKLADRSRTSSAEVAFKVGDKMKPKLKIEKSDYKGSAKPVTPTYTGSARPMTNKKAPPRRYDGYAGTDEEIDEEEDSEDYYSDESDMEAGAFDVEREEFEALKQAKRDDAAELALENRLKTEKAAKKARLQELVAGRLKRKESS